MSLYIRCCFANSTPQSGIVACAVAKANDGSGNWEMKALYASNSASGELWVWSDSVGVAVVPSFSDEPLRGFSATAGLGFTSVLVGLFAGVMRRRSNVRSMNGPTRDVKRRKKPETKLLVKALWPRHVGRVGILGAVLVRLNV